MARTLTPATWNKQFAKRLREQLGPNYPIPKQDWEDAEYYQRCERLSPKDAADKLAAARRQAVPERCNCKAWYDHYENGIYNPEYKGEFRCEPCVPPAVRITIQAAIEGGCTHGTVKHWENAFPQFHHLQDVRPVLFLWELL